MDSTKIKTDRDITIVSLFEKQVELHPDHTALLFNNKKLTYRELNNNANQIGHYLRSSGIKPNTLVAVCMSPSLELLTTILGILKAGGAYVPIDPSNPSNRQDWILQDSKATLCIRNAYLENAQAEIIQQDESNPVSINQCEDLCYVVYTSGSTGKPKGVMITHQNVQHFAHWFQNALSVKKQDIFDFSSSISFDFSVATTLFPLLTGATIAICPENSKRDPYLYLKHLQEKKASIIKLTPSHFRQLKEIILEEKIFLNLDLRYIIFGGETLFYQDIKDWIHYFPNSILFCEYGPSETTVATSWIKINKNNIHQFKHKIPIGKPALHTHLYILDTNMHPVSTGNLGELYIGGAGVAKGYLHHPVETAQKFIKSPFHPEDRLYKTGDICTYLPDGNIEFIERIDHQVKIRGYRIELEEIENHLLSHSDIKEAAVIAVEDRDDPREKKLVAYYIPKTHTPLDNKKLVQFLHQILPNYMIPSYFIKMESFPLSSSGKLDHDKLPYPEITLNQEKIPPHSELESILKTIWSDTLHIRHIGMEDNFFELGGHSLSAARILSKIRKTLKKEISLEEFYQFPTIRGLTKILNHSSDSQPILNISSEPNNIKEIPLNELQFLFWLMQLYTRSKIVNIVKRKRIQGKLDDIIFKKACLVIYKKHPILTYHINRFYPIQYQKNNIDLQVIESNIIDLSHAEREQILTESCKALEHWEWKKNSALVKIKVFHLENDNCEIQIAMSHFISDEISAEIFLADLSQCYLDIINNKKIDMLPKAIQYKDYILQEIELNNHSLKQNVRYWENYLNNVSLFHFPESDINDTTLNSCITYLKIPSDSFQKLQPYCTNNQISLSDCLCSLVSKTLVDYTNNHDKSIVLNLVRSTRENDIYDNCIGLFVRTDLIKLQLTQSSSFIEVCKQIQQSAIKSAQYQLCPIIVKLSCLLNNKWKNKKWLSYFFTLFSNIISNFMPKAKLNGQILAMYLRVFLARKKRYYFVAVNISNTFIMNNVNNSLFGHELIKLNYYKKNQIVEKNVLHIGFDRDEFDNAYVIISGNLKNDTRNLIGRKIIDIIQYL